MHAVLTCAHSSGAAGCHLSSASPVHSSTLVVPVGHNVSLLCNMTHRNEITWYLLRSEQLQPLLTVKEGKFGGTTDDHTNNHRMKCDGTLQTGLVSLEIQEVEEEDAGLYFCIGRFADKMHVNRGIQLTVDSKTIRCFYCQLELSCAQKLFKQQEHFMIHDEDLRFPFSDVRVALPAGPGCQAWSGG